MDLSRGEAEILQVFEGLVGLIGGHQHVIVVEAGYHVGAYAVARQLCRHGRRQPNRLQARVHPQRDAAVGALAVEAWLAIQWDKLGLEFWLEIPL